MSSSPPTTLGKYQIIREIARSNDIVYEAYDPLMNRRVAVKELAMPGGSTPQQKEDRIKRFLREARAAGSLTHPNIMTVFEVGQEGERYFIAMEYLDGHTLRNEIDTLGFLPADRALELAKEVLRGLEFAHQHGVIHRDIKPDNIQLLTDGRTKLTDFGIARLTFEPNLTMDGQVFGTPSYMSPEQVVGKEIDQRSDLFSVGVLLYEMIGGQKPFSGDSVVSITHAIMNKEPDKLQQANYAVWNVIAKALDKSPSMRYANATEMIEAIDAAGNADRYGNAVLDVPHIPQTTIYGSLPAPGANPYMTPFPSQPQPAPPPVMYPYNPYAQQSAPVPVQPPVPYQQPQGYQPNYPTPVFYPPPPRQPLMKAETRSFLGKLFVSLVVLGTLMVVIIVGVSALSNTYARMKAEDQDRLVVEQLRKIPANLPLDQRIAQTEAVIRQMRSEVAIKDAKKQLSVLYEQLGKQRMQANNLVGAEESFKNAVDQAPDDATLCTNLADLYGRQASVERDLMQRQALWQRAAEWWKYAAELEPRQSYKATYRVSAATAIYNDALAMMEAGIDSHDIRSVLYDGLTLAPENSEIRNRIQSLLDRA
jgi:eukaryotic-like serine/threonine-protein kinase